jgi:hypothetical protein
VDSAPQQFVFGFLLPSSHFSKAPSVDVVISVFHGLVNYINEKKAWDWYIRRSDDSPSVMDRDARARVSGTHGILQLVNLINLFQVKYDLEVGWSGNKQRNRELLDSFGPEVCASLVKVRSSRTRVSVVITSLADSAELPSIPPVGMRRDSCPDPGGPQGEAPDRQRCKFWELCLSLGRHVQHCSPFKRSSRCDHGPSETDSQPPSG